MPSGLTSSFTYPSRRLPAPRRVHLIREILVAVFYIVRSSCAWRLLAHDDYFPPWKTVYHYYFRLWRIDGTWEKLNAAIRLRLGSALGVIPNSAQEWSIRSR
jgi:putative transposase